MIVSERVGRVTGILSSSFHTGVRVPFDTAVFNLKIEKQIRGKKTKKKKQLNPISLKDENKTKTIYNI